jgi:hypothetical protein
LYHSKVIELVIDIVVDRNESKWVEFMVAIIIGVLITYTAYLGLFGTGVNISKLGCISG